MTPAPKHTPTSPYEETYGTLYTKGELLDAFRRPCPDEEYVANILKCLNSHDKLVEALRNLIGSIQGMQPNNLSVHCKMKLKDAIAALAAVEGE